jgi:hypothetical protein
MLACEFSLSSKYRETDGVDDCAVDLPIAAVTSDVADPLKFLLRVQFPRQAVNGQTGDFYI